MVSDYNLLVVPPPRPQAPRLVLHRRRRGAKVRGQQGLLGARPQHILPVRISRADGEGDRRGLGRRARTLGSAARVALASRGHPGRHTIV